MTDAIKSVILFFVVFLIMYFVRKRITSTITDFVMDKVTEKKINELHPAIKDKAKELVLALEKKGIHFRIYEALRSFERQLALYNQPFDGIDNDKDGIVDESDEKVTQAKPGDGFHNYALAFDGVEIKDGKALWQNPNWETIGRTAENLGLVWGGRWKFKDLPHFQIKGIAISHLKRLYAENRFDNNGFIKLT